MSSTWKKRLAATVSRSKAGNNDTPSASITRAPNSLAFVEDNPFVDDDASEWDPIITEDVVVHFKYDVANPPQRPDQLDVPADTGPVGSGDSQWTRFICISDTHCNTFDLPQGDFLLHSGDLTHTGRAKQVQGTMKWLKSQPHPHKIIIAGNHDLTLDRDFYLEHGSRWHRQQTEDVEEIKKFVEPQGDTTFHYLEYENMTITEGGATWKVYGSPGSPWFGGWAFNYEQGEAPELVSRIPNDTDILLTHGPPSGILDETTPGARVGCRELWKKVQSVRPKIHVFGHIHEARGAVVKYWDEEDATGTPVTGDLGQRRFTVFVNAATYPTYKHREIQSKGTEGYHYPPIIVDIRSE